MVGFGVGNEKPGRDEGLRDDSKAPLLVRVGEHDTTSVAVVRETMVIVTLAKIHELWTKQ